MSQAGGLPPPAFATASQIVNFWTLQTTRLNEAGACASHFANVGLNAQAAILMAKSGSTDAACFTHGIFSVLTPWQVKCGFPWPSSSCSVWHSAYVRARC